METALAIQSAQYRQSGGGEMVHVVLNGGTESSIYTGDGSPKYQLHTLLDEWVAAGNQISPAKQ